jgi:prokaryotic ubiquitin-like protein Pup
MSQQGMSSPGSSRAHDSDTGPAIPSAAQVSASGVDDLLDEIDSLLEENAEAFVKSFVQKGGQ